MGGYDFAIYFRRLAFFLSAIFLFSAVAKLGEQQSYLVDAKWKDRVRLLPNRGPEAVNILEHTLKMLDPETIKELPGFISFKNTRITLMSYDFRSAEVFHAVKKLVELGVKFQIVSDPSTVLPTELPSKKVQDKWSEHQLDYFLKTYDGHDGKGRDGVVSSEDIAAFNNEKAMGLRFWSELRALSEQHTGQIQLITSPNDVVPASDEHRFPRLQHIKALMIQFSVSARSIQWAPPAYLRLGSSNFTDTCMDPRGRVKGTAENIDKYFADPSSAKREKSTRGHVQFNIEIRALEGENHLEVFSQKLQKLIEGFKAGKHFDDLPVEDKRLPKIIFSDGTVLQPFFSEGIPTPTRNTDDPIERINTLFLSNPAMKLQEVIETQFVFTHHKKARTLRRMLVKALEEGTLEDVYLVVDGGFSTMRESAYDDLFFSDEVSVAETLSGRGILKSPQYPKNFDWRKKAYSYHGVPSLLIPPRKADKMHSKLAAYRYVDDHNQTVHLVVLGSGNSSTNAGRGNSDVFVALEVKDPKAWQTITAYKEGIKKSEVKRLYRLSEVWLLRALVEAFPEQLPGLLENNPKFSIDVSNFLSGKSPKTKGFADVWAPLLKLRVNSVYAKNLKAGLKWVASHENLSKNFRWADFELLMRLSDPTLYKTQAFLIDLRYRWVKGLFPVEYVGEDLKKQNKSFVALLRTLQITEHGPADSEETQQSAKKLSKVEAIIEKNMTEQCEFFLRLSKGTSYHPMEIYRLLELIE